MARIILASGSPRRQELLRRIGLREFEISVPDVEEWYPPELAPEDIVAYISREKSQAVQAAADAIVITADTMVFLDDQRLGKPHDEAEALSMLTALSGRKHKVCTGVTVRQGEKALTRAQSTDVYFREVSRQELLAYIRGGEPMDKAGAYGVQGLAAVTVVAVLLCVASALSSQTGFLQNAGGVIASPFRAVGSAVSGWFSSISQRFEDVEALQQENAELKKENAELQRQLDQAKIDSEENQRLRNLLNLRQQRRDFTFESAVIVDRSTSNWSRVMTLNKGTSSGIAVGNCVVDDQGNLVGVIREAGLNWSTITTILDTDSSLGARVFRTGEVTVAMGDLALMETGRLKLSYLEGESSLINGDLIVTSGLGGYYPSQLVIGSVEEIRTDDNGLTRYAVLAPKTDLDSLSEVFVITSFDTVD